MFIKMRAVKQGQPVFVGRKVRRHPIQQDAQALVVGGRDQRTEFFGCAVADGGGVHANGLIAPRAVKRVFGDRHHLDMGEAHVRHVIDQIAGQFFIRQGAVALGALPTGKVHFIDADRHVSRLVRGAVCHPRIIFPDVARNFAHNRSGLGRMF